MVGDVIRVDFRSCLNCEHALLNSHTTFCPIYSEHILDERATADDCPNYTPED